MFFIACKVLVFPAGDSGHGVHDMHRCNVDVQAAKLPVFRQLPQRLTNQCMVFPGTSVDFLLLCRAKVIDFRE